MALIIYSIRPIIGDYVIGDQGIALILSCTPHSQPPMSTFHTTWIDKAVMYRKIIGLPQH